MNESQKTGLAGLGLGTVILLLATAGCGDDAGETPPPPPTEVVIEVARTAPIEDILSAVGTVEANGQVILKSEVPGTIATIHFTEGSRVKAGSLLFEFDAAKERAQLAQARAEEAVALQNFERANQLAGTRAISRQELDQLGSQVAAREAFRMLQEERLRDLTITAPFDGVLGPRHVSPGQYVEQGLPLVSLVDGSRVKISYRIPERQLGRVRLAQNIRLTVAAYPDRTFDGAVDLISPLVDESTRTVQIRATASNQEDLLKPQSRR